HCSDAQSSYEEDGQRPPNQADDQTLRPVRRSATADQAHPRFPRQPDAAAQAGPVDVQAGSPPENDGHPAGHLAEGRSRTERHSETKVRSRPGKEERTHDEPPQQPAAGIYPRIAAAVTASLRK